VSRQVIWEAQAIDQAAGFLYDDPAGSARCLTRSRDSPMIPARPGRFRMGHLTDGGCASGVATFSAHQAEIAMA